MTTIGVQAATERLHIMATSEVLTTNERLITTTFKTDCWNVAVHRMHEATGAAFIAESTADVPTNTQSVWFVDLGNECGYSVLSYVDAPELAKVTSLSMATCAAFECSIRRRRLEFIDITEYATGIIILRLARPQTQTSVGDALATLWSVPSYRINVRCGEGCDFECRLGPEGEVCYQTLKRLFPTIQMRHTGYDLHSNMNAGELQGRPHNDVAHHLGRLLGYISTEQCTKTVVCRLSDRKLVCWDGTAQRFVYLHECDWNLIQGYGFDAEMTFLNSPILTKHGFPWWDKAVC